MKFIITDSTEFIYGQFPTKICASLALKGMSTMLDDLIIKEVN
jgi:hypothetical protein